MTNEEVDAICRALTNAMAETLPEDFGCLVAIVHPAHGDHGHVSLGTNSMPADVLSRMCRVIADHYDSQARAAGKPGGNSAN